VHIAELASQPLALIWLTVLIGLAVASVVLIIAVEWHFPARDLASAGTTKGKARQALSVVMSEGAPFDHHAATTCTASSVEAAAAVANDGESPVRMAPPWLERFLSFWYPASFGIDEGIAHLWMRAETAMSTQCIAGGCANGTFALALCLRWGASVATAFWLVVVFRRYEATSALPIEYGTATIVDMASGFLFYREHESMETWQLVLVIVGCVVVVGGICVTQRHASAAIKPL